MTLGCGLELSVKVRKYADFFSLLLGTGQQRHGAFQFLRRSGAELVLKMLDSPRPRHHGQMMSGSVFFGSTARAGRSDIAQPQLPQSAQEGEHVFAP